MTAPIPDPMLLRRAEQQAQAGEFASAVETAAGIQDRTIGDLARVAIADGQAVAGDFRGASSAISTLSFPWTRAEALRLVALEAARAGQDDRSRAAFQQAAECTQELPGEQQERLLARVAMAAALAGFLDNHYRGLSRGILDRVGSAARRAEVESVLELVACSHGDASEALTRARDLAREAPDDGTRDEILSAVAICQAAVGDLNGARRTGREIRNEWARSKALFAACDIGLRRGHRPSIDLALAIDNPWLQRLAQAASEARDKEMFQVELRKAMDARNQADPRAARPPIYSLNSINESMLDAMRPGREAGTLQSALFKIDDLHREAARPIDDNVQFSVYRPHTVRPQEWNTLLAFAHLAERRPGETGPTPLERVEQEARQVLAGRAKDYGRTTQDSTRAVPRDGELTFQPQVDGVAFNPPCRSFRWVEDVHREEFRFRADSSDGKTARGHLSVFLGSLLVADIPLAIRVDSTHRAAQAEPTERVAARPYRNIFASYSHKDEAIVRDVERHALSLGDRYLRDRIHLRSGEVWSTRIGEMIEEADVFQLFWSNNSMQSEYVRQEWEHALALGRPNFVRPTYWEEPMPEQREPPLPPLNLARLHFERLPMGGIGPAEPWPAAASGKTVAWRGVSAALVAGVLAAVAVLLIWWRPTRWALLLGGGLLAVSTAGIVAGLRYTPRKKSK